MNDEAKCDCQHCGGHIAFATEQAGQTIVCPHCGKETLMDVPAQPSQSFFVWKNDQQQGPFDQETIQRMISEGQITDDTLLCLEDGGLDWTPAKELFLQDSWPEDLVAVNDDQGSPHVVAESLVEIKINQFHSFFYQPAKVGDNAFVQIRLQSGVELRITAVRLFDESTLVAIARRRAEAAQGHQGVSTGLGSIGSLGWVLGSALVIGAVEGALSAGAATAGTNSLNAALELEKRLRESYLLLPVSIIQNIEHPLPGAWRVAGESRFQIPGQQPNSHKTWLIHNGDDFLAVQTDDGAVRSIRWSAVESYVCQNPKRPA